MKKLFRTMLCAALLTMAVSIPTFAAETQVPEKQGDFYVLVNGQYVTFTDAVPQIKDSRSCLPFVAVFEQLGFAEEDMTWDNATKTVTATKDDTTISLSIGKTAITLSTGTEDAKEISTDVAPYVDPTTSRTYVPFGLVADALGYSVGWDAQQKAVIIDDVDAILEANTETYALMDQYMAYSKTFYEENQKVTGAYSMNMDVTSEADGSSSDLAFDLTGNYNMLTAGSTAFEMTTDMTMDMTMTLDGTDVSDMLQGEDGIQLPMTIDMELRGDMGTGAFYYQCAALDQLIMGQTDSSGCWYKLDLKQIFDEMSQLTGMDYATLLKLSQASTEQAFAETLDTMLRAMPLTSVDFTTTDYLNMLNAMLGDSAFEKSGSSYVNTLEQDGVKMIFTLTTSGSEVNGYSMEFVTADPALAGMEMSITASMKENKMDVGMVMDMTVDLGTGSTTVHLDFAMDGDYQSTNKTPATEPPAGAQVVDIMEMLSSTVPAPAPESEA
ncbi:MAG: copper amine oxidase N-terminal domain-containing protein [Lawsonibacter sp.]